MNNNNNDYSDVWTKKTCSFCKKQWYSYDRVPRMCDACWRSFEEYEESCATLRKLKSLRYPDTHE